MRGIGHEKFGVNANGYKLVTIAKVNRCTIMRILENMLSIIFLEDALATTTVKMVYYIHYAQVFRYNAFTVGTLFCQISVGGRFMWVGI